MQRRITPRTTLEHLKREAKRWLRALRENVGDAAAEARARLERATPDAPRVPSLRQVQHALARELGFDGWGALKQKLLDDAGDKNDSAERDARIALFLEYACPDHHIRGGPAHSRAMHAALRMLERYPEIAHDTFYTAVVCGEREEVEQTLADDPGAATRKPGGDGDARSGAGHFGDELRPLGRKTWEPLLFHSFTRLPIESVNENSIAIATALLDHGADPNAFFMAGDSRYTPLVGVIGEGEEGRLPHPQRDALVRLLLDRGAEPYDIQVIYNIHFEGNILWFLELIYEESLKRGRRADWDDPDWTMLGMGGYGPGAHYLLSLAVRKNDLLTAEWILLHGASPNLPTNYSHPRFRPEVSLYEMAVRSGFAEMAELLATFGAARVPIVVTGDEEFTAAVLRLDRDSATRLAAEHPEYLRMTSAPFKAAKENRVGVTQLLFDLGMSPDVEDAQYTRPLHHAAWSNAVDVARLLVARGAEIDPVEGNWGGTPLGSANYSQSKEMIALLAPLSSDFWELVVVGAVDRVRELLAEQPERARLGANENQSPLMWLPSDDEQRALEMAKLLVQYGADPTIVNKEGQTAADRAVRLGMYEIADFLRSGGARPRTATSSDDSPPLRLEDYEVRVQTLLDAYRTGTPEAMERLYSYTWHRRTWSAFRTYLQLDLDRAADDPDKDRDITLDDARFLIAREYGFDGWKALTDYAEMLPATIGAVAAKPVALLLKNTKGAANAAERTRDWDTAFATIADRRLDGLDAEGQMTDALLDHVAALEHITVLKIGGSHGVTDDGLRHLARLPQLEHLELDGCSITDAGLSVLAELRELKSISLAWTRISDAGAANLSACARLENVNLMGTSCGDGTIGALRGKPNLRHFRTGNNVTDAGLPLLHEFPAFKTWQGGEPSMALLSYNAEPNQLTLRGPFTDRGVASLVGLDGLFGLNVDDSKLVITGAALAPLVSLPHLGWLAFDAKDDAMPHIAALPRLRFLGCQDASASDNGWVALSKSPSIEYIWGRRCYGLSDHGFTAMANMPALRGLSVSCKNVSDAALSAFPRFPALRQLVPMDVPDEGYRFIGRCDEMDSLILMYCRETTDRSTEHIARLPKLRKYFASYNKITDRSLEILGGIRSLEEVELSAVAGVTNAGIAALARLPHLREVRLSGNQLTREVLTLFPPHVHVHYEF